MTDRFYPLGQPSAEGVWQTSYEAQNEMRTHQRSAYPPGYAGFEPGTREKFGFSSPGPDALRLSASELALTEDAEAFEPRRIHAIPRMQVPDDRKTFNEYDLPAAERSGFMPTAGSQAKTLPRVRSLPTLERKPPPPPLRQLRGPVDALEDRGFSYFVPRSLQNMQRERLANSRIFLPKVDKADRVVLSIDGDGTGFRTQCHEISWCPARSGVSVPRSSSATASKSAFGPPPFYRMSPLGMLKEPGRTC